MQAKQRADFVEYCRKIGEGKRSPNTRTVWENAVKHLQHFTGGPIQFSKVNHSLLQSFKDYLLSKVSQNSAGVYLARIKTACHQAVRDGILLRNPADVSIRTQRTRRQFLTLEELGKLAATPCSNRDTKAAFLFSSFSGLRFGDVKALTWSKVKRSNGSCALEFSQGKTGEAETLPLSAEAAAIIEGQENASLSPRIRSKVDNDAIFKLGAQQTIDKAIRQWVKRAGIEKKISFHSGRHTFATMGLANGIDIYTMSKLLGHKSIKTTEIYLHMLDETKQQAVEMLPLTC